MSSANYNHFKIAIWNNKVNFVGFLQVKIIFEDRKKIILHFQRQGKNTVQRRSPQSAIHLTRSDFPLNSTLSIHCAASIAQNSNGCKRFVPIYKMSVGYYVSDTTGIFILLLCIDLFLLFSINLIPFNTALLFRIGEGEITDQTRTFRKYKTKPEL